MSKKKIVKPPIKFNHPDFTIEIYEDTIIIVTWGKRYVIMVDKVRKVNVVESKEVQSFELGDS